MKNKVFRTVILSIAALIGIASGGLTPLRADLAGDFISPPAEARPWVYWFWLNGNITREGITADLEAMKRVGIGGVLIMVVDQGAPVGPVDFMGTKWRELFKFVVSEALRLGLEVNMTNDAGWNGSGGPWITPEQSMQKVVLTETAVEGPLQFNGILPKPETIAGFYRDIEVLAVPTTGAFRIDGIKEKACYEVASPGPATSAKLEPEMVIQRNQIIDLSAKMDKDGKLNWDVPPGKWTVLRLGHTSTGKDNHPAPATGRGLECDKLSKEGSEANFNGMMAKLIADVGRGDGKALVSTHIDSWENGAQNWTACMREEFTQRRGYDPFPWLPVMTGRVIDSLEISERFLWDLRRTISELIVENYARHIRNLANQHGLRLSIEAYGGPCDDAPYAGSADEPMAEFWVNGGAWQTCKEMASAAHTYGKPVVAAEAFTADDKERWQAYPGSIKSLGDKAMCDGINRFVFHRYAMQPWLNYTPGMTMGPWGLHYERTNTWWEQSRPWHEYLARCHYLLRQGKFAADICLLQREASPQGYADHERRGYDFDNCSAEVLLTRMQVKDGRLVLPDGMSYRILALPNTPEMSPALLRKIKELADAGAKIVGPRPVRSPSLTGYPQCDQEVKELADELWGQGKVIDNQSPEKVLASMSVPPDFSSKGRLRWIHRIAGDTDIYFVASNSRQPTITTCAFRVSGKRPEFWNPETGRIQPALVYEEEAGVTRIPIPFDPSGSVFVVFRPAKEKSDPVFSVMRDGQPVLSSMADALPKIIVEKASYGVLDDPSRTRDVRARAQALLDGGQTSFPVTEMAEGGDPAYGVVKTLEIDYTVNGNRLHASAKDRETIRLSLGLGGKKYVVQKATYRGTDDAARSRDVTAEVQALIDSGETDFQVARLAAGGDPAFKVVKILSVEYTVDGKPCKASALDPETIDLAEIDPVEQTASLQHDADGKLLLTSWKNGAYEIKTASGRLLKCNVSGIPDAREITGAWDLQFPAESGAPEKVALDRLLSWSEHADTGVKYFSGTATYSKKIAIPKELLARGRAVYLDLGKVAVMAQVKLNGNNLGILWKAPYRVEITHAAKPGDNILEIQVTNLPINRMIGDEQMPEDSDRNPAGTLKAWPKWVQEGKPSPTGRHSFTTWRLWKKDSPLQESGLLGPVTLQCSARLAVPEKSKDHDQ